MAHPAKRLPENAPGEVFVDATCIDCGACRWIAPAVFGALDDFAYVHAQPAGPEGSLRAGLAAVACPVGAIGGADVRAGRDLLPEPWGDGVHYLGFHARDSFGAASWLIVRPGGNVMIDTPRPSRRLTDAIEALGGIDTIFLTHRDDVGAHARFAARFGARRVMHRDDMERGTAAVERPIEGTDPVALADDLVVIPTPGHTRGSACLLHSAGDEGYLFSGDHLAFARARPDGTLPPTLIAFRDACWYDWAVQTAAMERLLAHRFTWVLPGHGRPGRLEADAMRRALEDLIGRMRAR
jgi:glyoxylase-like metal-dependent hydrolase (beta-lactamase superfamily II)